jgi:RpiB/LacA/LacB family sugar-phosphate isomerase
VNQCAAIGSDHAGFELKEALKTFLATEHHEAVDVGTHSPDPVDYPDYAQAVGAAVREPRAERGSVVVFAIGAVLFGYALARFRATIGTMV